MNRSQHTKLTLEKKILPPLLWEFKLTTFQSQVQCSYQQAIPAPMCNYFSYPDDHPLENGEKKKELVLMQRCTL